jgi:hypothetical protein
MKRIIFTALAVALLSVVVGPALAGDQDLKTSEGVRQFFEQIQHNGT